MARKRMIDPQIWASEDFSELSHFAKLVWIGLFSQADDKGRGKSKPAYLKSILFPYSEDVKLIKKVDSALNEIANKMSIVFYQIDKNEYYQLENWAKWQKVEKPQESKIPPFLDTSTNIRGIFGEQSGNSRQPVPPNKNKNRIRMEENRKEERDNARACAREEISLAFPGVVVNCEIPEDFDCDRVSAAISESDYLKQVTSFSWIIDNYDKVVSGYYKNLKKDKQEHINRSYSKDDFKSMVQPIDEIRL